MTMQLPLEFAQQNPSGTFANYMPGNNEPAYRTLQQVVRRQTENCIYLWGPSGTGKTHLLNAACHATAVLGGTPGYVPLENPGVSPEILDGMENLDVVCLDNIQYIVGQREWESAVFRLFNQLRDTGIPLVIAGNNAPNALGLRLTDLVSRFTWGGVFYLKPLEEAYMREVVLDYAAGRGMALPAAALTYLMRHAPRDLKTLLGWVERIDYVSLSLKKKPNTTMVRNLMTGKLSIVRPT